MDGLLELHELLVGLCVPADCDAKFVEVCLEVMRTMNDLNAQLTPSLRLHVVLNGLLEVLWCLQNRALTKGSSNF